MMWTIGFWCSLIIAVSAFVEGNIGGGFIWLCMAGVCWAKYLTKQLGGEDQ